MDKFLRALDETEHLLSLGKINEGMELLQGVFAQESFRRDLALDERLSKRLTQLGIRFARTMVESGCIDDARALLSVLKSHAKASESSTFDCYLAWCDLRGGDPERGIEGLKGLLARTDSEGIAAVCYQMLGEYFLSAGRNHEAVAIYDQCLSRFLGREGMEDIVAGAMLGSSDALNALGKRPEALAWLTKVKSIRNVPKWAVQAVHERTSVDDRVAPGK